MCISFSFSCSCACVCVCVDCSARACARAACPAIERICKKKCNDTPAQEAAATAAAAAAAATSANKCAAGCVYKFARRPKRRSIASQKEREREERWHNVGTHSAGTVGQQPQWDSGTTTVERTALGHGLSPAPATSAATIAFGQLSSALPHLPLTRALLLLRWRVTHRVVFRFVCKFCTMRLPLTSLPSPRWLRRRRC